MPASPRTRLRRFLRPLRLLLVTALSGVAAAAWGFGIEPGLLRVRETAVELPGWDRPLRVALVSDLHAGAPFISHAQIDRVVATVNGTRPDLVLLLGDYVIDGVKGGEFMEPEAIAGHLARLTAPTYAVLGNHDAWNEPERVERAFEAAGVTVLRNESARIAGLTIVGLDDPWARGPDPGVFDHVDGAVLVAVHNPDVIADIPVGTLLTVAGHTHGGQVSFPGFAGPLQPTETRFADGFSRVDGRRLFVTPGIGTSMLPVRFGMPPTVDVLVLE